MKCEDCSFFIDEMCTDDIEGYINKRTGLPICRYNPNAVPREKRNVAKCSRCEDMAEILHESLSALRGLVVCTDALLIGLHDVLGISPDDFPVAINVVLEQARFAITLAENCKA